jgi:GNAT superfamily N-acetyltransferase
MPYFNYRVHSIDPMVASYWERREFLQSWWSLYQDDNRWTPPHYTRMRREMDPRHNSHLGRLQARLIRIDALYRTGLRRGRTDQQEIPLTSVLERPLAAAMPIVDPRRQDRTAHLAMLHVANDEEAFDTLYYHLVESLSAAGCRRIIGPVGLSPHLQAGTLADGWSEWPPQHTSSNPPYLLALLERRFRLLQTGRLYHAGVPAESSETATGPASRQSFDPVRLAGDLLPLLASVTTNPTAGFPPPDVDEASSILRQLDTTTLIGCLALVDDDPTGFVLMGPDGGGRLRATRGGKPLWGRIRLAATHRQPVVVGRISFGGVLPSWQGRGIGRQLWSWALQTAREHEWTQLTIGPVWSRGSLTGGPSPSEAFLARCGAVPRQTYCLYERSF